MPLPIVTQSAGGAASSIAGAILHTPDEAVFTYRGGVPTWAGVGFPANTYYTCIANLTSPAGNPNYRTVFLTDAPVFEIRLKGSAPNYRLQIDHQLVTALSVAGPPADGAAYLLKVDFSAVRKVRRITIEGNLQFGGINIGPTDTIWKVPAHKVPRAIFIGDSYTEGTGADSGITGFYYTCSELLGWKDWWQSGVGSTGYLNPGGGGKVKFRDRVQHDVIAFNPDFVVVCGGINDSGFVAADVGTEAGLLYAALKTGLPKARIYVQGPFWPRSSTIATITPFAAAIKAAALAAGLTYLDNITVPWFTGSGKLGTPTGDGNADYYTSADNTHPTQDGHVYLGRRMANAIESAAA